MCIMYIYIYIHNLYVWIWTSCWFGWSSNCAFWTHGWFYISRNTIVLVHSIDGYMIHAAEPGFVQSCPKPHTIYVTLIHRWISNVDGIWRFQNHPFQWYFPWNKPTIFWIPPWRAGNPMISCYIQRVNESQLRTSRIWSSCIRTWQKQELPVPAKNMGGYHWVYENIPKARKTPWI